MKSKLVLTGLAALLVLVFISPTRLMAARGGSEDYYFGFENSEKSLASWKTASDTPSVSSSIGIASGENGCPDMLGFHYAVLKSGPAFNSFVSKAVPYPIGSWALTALPAGGRKEHKYANTCTQ